MDIIEIFEPSEDITVEVSDNINIDLEIINNDFIPIPIGEDCNFDIDAAVFVKDHSIERYDSKSDLPQKGNESNLYIVGNRDIYIWDKTKQNYTLINGSQASIGDGILSIKQNSNLLKSFTANSFDNVDLDIQTPTKTSELENDSNFIKELDKENIDIDFSNYFN